MRTIHRIPAVLFERSALIKLTFSLGRIADEDQMIVQAVIFPPARFNAPDAFHAAKQWLQQNVNTVRAIVESANFENDEC